MSRNALQKSSFSVTSSDNKLWQFTGFLDIKVTFVYKKWIKEVRKMQIETNGNSRSRNKTLPTAVDYWGAHEQQALQGVSEII